MTRKRFFVGVVGGIAVLIAVSASAVISGISSLTDFHSHLVRPSVTSVGADASPLPGAMDTPQEPEAAMAEGAEAQDIRTLESEIESLEREIQARQVQIERENVVKTLNENKLNDYERKLLFELLNTQASARTRQIELRMKRLRLLVEQGSES